MTSIHPQRLILASQSPIRAALLKQAGLSFETRPARVDEDAIREGLLAESTRPRQVADYLAETKAQAVALREGDGFIIGSDQIITCNDKFLEKSKTSEDLAQQMRIISGQKLEIFAAAVIFEGHRPVWRHIGVAQCFVKVMNDDVIKAYVRANFDEVKDSVGGFHIEGRGVTLFDRILGDYYAILGMPIIEILAYLRLRGVTT